LFKLIKALEAADVVVVVPVPTDDR